MTPDEILIELSEFYKKKNAMYGSTYLQFGELMNIMFPTGLILKTPEDFNRFALLNHMMNKIMRSAALFVEGGSSDSNKDLAVYAAMLEAIELK